MRASTLRIGAFHVDQLVSCRRVPNTHGDRGLANQKGARIVRSRTQLVRRESACCDSYIVIL